MLTTVGSNCFEICENWLESCCGEGILKGVASEPFFSWPFTPLEITVPIRMPTVNVANIVSVYAGRLAFRRAQKPLASGSIRTSSSGNSALTLYLFVIGGMKAHRLRSLNTGSLVSNETRRPRIRKYARTDRSNSLKCSRLGFCAGADAICRDYRPAWALLVRA